MASVDLLVALSLGGLRYTADIQAHFLSFVAYGIAKLHTLPLMQYRHKV